MSLKGFRTESENHRNRLKSLLIQVNFNCTRKTRIRQRLPWNSMNGICSFCRDQSTEASV